MDTYDNHENEIFAPKYTPECLDEKEFKNYILSRFEMYVHHMEKTGLLNKYMEMKGVWNINIDLPMYPKCKYFP